MQVHPTVRHACWAGEGMGAAVSAGASLDDVASPLRSTTVEPAVRGGCMAQGPR